jgi:hypothetical protein
VPGILVGGGVNTFQLLTICEWWLLRVVGFNLGTGYILLRSILNLDDTQKECRYELKPVMPRQVR